MSAVDHAIDSIETTARGPARARRAGATTGKTAGAGRGRPQAGGRDAILERALRRIDPEIARSFTPEQCRAIRTLLDLRSAGEPLVDLRQGFTLAGRRYFLAMLLGRERRRRTRGASVGLRGWLRDHTVMLIASAGLLALVFCLAALLRG